MNDLGRAYLECIKKSNSVSLHVRRGDYLNLKNIGVLDVDYYMTAVDTSERMWKIQSFIFFQTIWNGVRTAWISGGLYLRIVLRQK